MDDGTTKLFLSTKGTDGCIKINDNEPKDDFTRKLQEEVEMQRDDDGKRALYMTYNQTLMEFEEKGKIKGREEGREEGKIEMIKEMLQEHQTLEFISKISKFSQERILEIGRLHGLL